MRPNEFESSYFRPYQMDFFDQALFRKRTSGALSTWVSDWSVTHRGGGGDKKPKLEKAPFCVLFNML